nr:MAG TPA: Radical SAM superfamily [Caudoviricetes sp.]
MAICPLFCPLCPLLKTKVGSEKPSIYAGLRGFCPLSHFFS